MDLLPQLTFRPALPVVLINVDYQLQEAQLKEMDRILSVSGLEEEFAQRRLLIWLGDRDEANVPGKVILSNLVDEGRGAPPLSLSFWRLEPRNSAFTHAPICACCGG